MAIKIVLHCAAIVLIYVHYAPDSRHEIQNTLKIFTFYALKFAKRVPLNAASMHHIKKAVLLAQKLANNALRFAQWLKTGRIFTI